jgi:Skp family chaperone for outer membrane proteins
MTGKMSLLALPLLAALACGGSKAPVVVVVSMDRVAQESVRAKRTIGEVEAFAKSVEDKLNQTADQLQAAAQDPRVSPADLRSMQAQWDQLRQEAEQQVDLRKRKAEEEIRGAVEEAVTTLAKEQGWELVIRKDDHSAMWAADALDRTGLVIQRMDALAPGT